MQSKRLHLCLVLWSFLSLHHPRTRTTSFSNDHFTNIAVFRFFIQSSHAAYLPGSLLARVKEDDLARSQGSKSIQDGDGIRRTAEKRSVRPLLKSFSRLPSLLFSVHAYGGRVKRKGESKSKRTDRIRAHINLTPFPSS
jgi:hypothetical protein